MTNSNFPTGEVARFRERVLGVLRRCHWPSLISGAAVSFAGLYVQTTQPLLSHIRQLERRIGAVDSRLYQLTGTTHEAENANHLLGVLITQGERVAAAREALDSMTDLQRALAVSAEQAEDARAVAGRWHELAGNLIAAQNEQAQAAQAIEEIDALQQDVVALGTAAADGQADIASSRAILTDVANLQLQLAATAEATGAARNALDGIDALQQRLVVEGARTGAAQQSADGLVALQASLSSLPQINAAVTNAEQLIGLQQTLSADPRLQLATATENAETMIALQESLSGQTGRIVASVENVELLADFQDELSGQLAQVESLRRQLTELMLLEATVSRTMTALEPLTELGNLRRLDDAQLREVARTMLDRRHERVAEATSKYDAVTEPAADISVPEPAAE